MRYEATREPGIGSYERARNWRYASGKINVRGGWFRVTHLFSALATAGATLASAGATVATAMKT